MGVTAYGNGPLPDFLKEDAYVSAEDEEFALGADDAKQYLDWCRRNDHKVLGLETWRLTDEGHAAVEGAVCEGDARACRASIDTLAAKHEGNLVFSIWVEPEQE